MPPNEKWQYNGASDRLHAVSLEFINTEQLTLTETKRQPKRYGIMAHHNLPITSE